MPRRIVHAPMSVIAMVAAAPAGIPVDGCAGCRVALMAVRWRSAFDGGVGSFGWLVVAVVVVGIAAALVASAGALAVLVVPPGTTGRASDGGRSVVVEAVVAVMVVGGNASDWAGAAGGIGAVLPGEATAGLTTGAAFGGPVGRAGGGAGAGGKGSA